MIDWNLQRMTTEELFNLWRKTKDPKARDELIYRHMDLAKALAKRFSGRGEPIEDLIQVAIYGLINAIDRYDPKRGVKFSSFAIPTILGELKRYFRDNSWSLHIPRGLKELNNRAYKLLDILTSKLGRTPTMAELAQELGVGEEEALEAMEAVNVYESLSLGQEILDEGGEEKLQFLSDSFSSNEDDLLEVYQKRQFLDKLMRACLNEREQNLIKMRFFEELNQAQIAKRLGVSQMHVSRLLRQALRKMKIYLEGEKS